MRSGLHLQQLGFSNYDYT